MVYLGGMRRKELFRIGGFHRGIKDYVTVHREQRARLKIKNNKI